MKSRIFLYPQCSTPFPHSSVVDHLLKTPGQATQQLAYHPLFPSPAWSPTCSASPASSIPSPCSITDPPGAATPQPSPPAAAWKEETKDDVERSTLAASTVSALDVADETVPGAVTYEPINLPDFHAYIDDIVLSVKREIRAENIKMVNRAENTKVRFASKIAVPPVRDEQYHGKYVAGIPNLQPNLDYIVPSFKKEIRAENIQDDGPLKKRVVRRASMNREEVEPAVVPPPGEGEERKEEEDGFMICCGRRAKPIDISARKRKLPMKAETAASAKKKKVMDAVEMATRIRTQNRAAAKKYRQRMKERRMEMDEETEVLEQEQARLLQHVQQLTVEVNHIHLVLSEIPGDVEEYKQKLLRMDLRCPFPLGDNG
ncbi:hypothetical protein PRIPAC_78841 [Pristionchus pacificus]|uniref:BZIP domain-containing protein n=1 Tax=Pristionchus pacificus TaxID=54126 RepID=A0A2A6BXF1_PRIPA|nr:hypothetical protein PRIPAC_78841 [Pristionchus pacificus]|eukprot:PDM70443.1 hypothetical protein PRIPAC_46689 [Pristionchus pacificus]